MHLRFFSEFMIIAYRLNKFSFVVYYIRFNKILIIFLKSDEKKNVHRQKINAIDFILTK